MVLFVIEEVHIKGFNLHLESDKFHDTVFGNVFEYFEDDLCENTIYIICLIKIMYW
jgi:hypothetical protein